ncbi:MAG TPA: sigma-70 family RNA polymerase sigma factor [Blastocatellia bacterium]|nr:sigma-70 family RNA polymerase sigma factor [Blastocatellia bacterium]
MSDTAAAGDWAILVGQIEKGNARETDNRSTVEAARDGDQEAFKQLYDSYAPLVHGILLARAPLPEVDDLVQEVFATAFRRMHTLRDSGSFGGWIATIARNRAVDALRRLRETREAREELVEGRPASVNIDSDARARKIVEVIRELPEAYSETLLLRLVEGMTGPEIARRTGLTPASVRVNLHRGMKLLRERLVEEGLA